MLRSGGKVSVARLKGELPQPLFVGGCMAAAASASERRPVFNFRYWSLKGDQDGWSEGVPVDLAGRGSGGFAR